MILPPDVAFHPDYHLFTWKPRGVLDEQKVTQIVSFIEEQERVMDQSFNRFTDSTALDSVDLNFDFVFHVALCRRLIFAARPQVKSAFLVSNRKSSHYFKLAALLTDHSPLQVKIFDERDGAAFWLQVPRKVLELP